MTPPDRARNTEPSDVRTLQPDDLFRLRFILDGQLSPDGQQVAYVVSHADAEEEAERSAIWIMSLETGSARQLTAGRTRDTQPRWSPDGKTVAFRSEREAKPQLFLIPVDGGEARQLTDMAQGVGAALAWSPDGKQIAYSACPVAEPRDRAKPYRVTRHVYRFDGLEYLDDAMQGLYVIAVAGGDPRALTDDRNVNTRPQWSPDGAEILYLAAMSPDTHRALFPQLCIVSLADGTTREVAEGWDHIGAAAWTPDGARIVFTGTRQGLPIGSKADLWIVSRSGGEPENRSAGLKVGVGGALQDDMPVLIPPRVRVTADDMAYVQVQAGGVVHIYGIALHGHEACALVVGGERSCFLLDADARHLLFAASTLSDPIDLCLADRASGSERRLTNLNDALLSGITTGPVEHLQFAGRDGVPVEGWMVLPPAGVPPYATILYIHGGPHGAFGHVFHFDTQMLAGAGYAVLLVNHRASTGYGDVFATAIKGDWGDLDYRDLMAGVDAAVAAGLADPDRLGVCGLSGGGNLSCWIVGHTDRFKAAVPENPVTNWVSFYGVSDIGVWFAVEELGGHPHEIPEVYARCSPITYAHRCTTPTLLIQGEQDWRCPAEQSEQFYAVLKANGCPVAMLRLPRASHAGSISGAPAVRRAQNEALLGWMNRYVLGQEAPD